MSGHRQFMIMMEKEQSQLDGILYFISSADCDKRW